MYVYHHIRTNKGHILVYPATNLDSDKCPVEDVLVEISHFVPDFQMKNTRARRPINKCQYSTNSVTQSLHSSCTGTY